MTDPTRAAAVAALAEVYCGFIAFGTPSHYQDVAVELLDAILANPDHRRALLAVLTDTDTFKVAVEWTFAAPGDFGPAKGYYGPNTEHFVDMLRSRLTEPTDTGGELDLDRAAWDRHVEAEHDATHGEAEQCGADCMRLGLTEPTDTGSGT